MQGRAGKPGPAGPAGQKVRIYYHLPMIFETVCIRVKMELQEQWYSRSHWVTRINGRMVDML